MPREADIEKIIEEIKRELEEYEIGGEALDRIFEPLFEACRRVAKTAQEFRQCVREGLSTLEEIVRKRIR